MKLRYLKTLPIGKKEVYLVVHRQRLECLDCGSIKYASLELALPKMHWTKALGRYIISLLSYCTIMDVSKHLNLHWNPVKEIHSIHLRDELLQLNEPLNSAYILKEKLLRLWKPKSKNEAIKNLNKWLLQAFQSKVVPLVKFAWTLVKYYFGIVNYFEHRITTGMVEGINNKIKTMKRQAYGFRDIEYFKLRICFINKARYSLVG